MSMAHEHNPDITPAEQFAPYARDPDDDCFDVAPALEQVELARERTQLSLQRTSWAAERTLNAWLRTALASVAAGLGIIQFVTSRVEWLPAMVGATFIAAGAAVYGFSLYRYGQEIRRLTAAGAVVTPMWIIAWLIGPMLLAALVGLFFALD